MSRPSAMSERRWPVAWFRPGLPMARLQAQQSPVTARLPRSSGWRDNDASRPACAPPVDKLRVMSRVRWISATRPVDSQKNLVITLRTPCATCHGGSRKSLTTEGGPVPGISRGTWGGAGRPAISRGARYPVAAGCYIGRRVIGSRGRPGWARPLHLIHGGASARLCRIPFAWLRHSPYFIEYLDYRHQICTISADRVIDKTAQ